MKQLCFKINPGQEVIEVLTDEFKKLDLKTGSITLIGAVDLSCISNMERHDAKQNLVTYYNEPQELSGVGEILDGKPHIHCTLSCSDNSLIHGHLQWARVNTWYVSVYVIVE